MNDNITFYYYTAWDGFAWQGCDEVTANSLQDYMEATKTLPKSSTDEPPFGGVVACKISGQFGVAVFRYLTRKKGDLSGRDSLYLALAFIPLASGCVDFSALLELPQLTTPQPGRLGPEVISISQNHLRLTDAGVKPDAWWNEDIPDADRILKGREGLRRLSVLFFSESTQLGFLKAVFRSDAGLDNLVATQSYCVYPEVSAVVKTMNDLRLVRERNGGVLERNDKTMLAVRTAIDKLRDWSKKLSGYPGLRKYCDEQEQETNDDHDRLKKVDDFLSDLIRDWNDLEKLSRKRVVETKDADDCGRFVRKAQGVTSLPVLDHADYKDAVKLSLKVQACASLLLERHRCAKALAQADEKCTQATAAQKAAEDARKTVERENARLRGELGNLNSKNVQLQTTLNKLSSENVWLQGGQKDLNFKIAQLEETLGKLSYKNTQLQTTIDNLNSENAQLQAVRAGLYSGSVQPQTAQGNLNSKEDKSKAKSAPNASGSGQEPVKNPKNKSTQSVPVAGKGNGLGPRVVIDYSRERTSRTSDTSYGVLSVLLVALVLAAGLLAMILFRFKTPDGKKATGNGAGGSQNTTNVVQGTSSSNSVLGEEGTAGQQAKGQMSSNTVDKLVEPIQRKANDPAFTNSVNHSQAAGRPDPKPPAQAAGRPDPTSPAKGDKQTDTTREARRGRK